MPHRAHIATLLTDLFTETELRRLLATWYPQWLRNGLAASLNPAQCTHVAVDVLYQHGHLPDPPPPPTLSLFDHLRSERHHQHAKINAVEQKHCCQATKPLYRHPPPSSGLSLSTDLPPPSPYQQLATRAPTTRLHLKIVDGRAALFKDQRVIFSDRSVDYTRLPATPPLTANRDQILDYGSKLLDHVFGPEEDRFKAFQAAGFPGPSAFAARLSVEADAVWQQLPWAFLADGPQFLREFGWTFEIAAPSGDAQRLPSPFHLLILVPEESEQENAPIGAHLHVEQLRHLLEGTWKQPQSPHVVVVHGREQLAEVLPKQSFHALYVYSRAVHRRGEILLDLGGRNYAIRDLQKDVPGLLLAYLNLLLPGDWAPPPFPGPCVVLPPPGLDPAAAADLALNWWRELVEGHRDPLVATASLPSAGAWRTRLVCPWMWWETQMSLGARLHHLALQHVDRHVQRGATAEAVEHFKTAPNARAQLLVGFGNEADHVEALSSQLVAHIRPANKSWYSLDTIDVPFPEQATPAHLRAALLERLQAAEVVAGLEARKKLIDPRDRRPRIVWINWGVIDPVEADLRALIVFLHRLPTEQLKKNDVLVLFFVALKLRPDEVPSWAERVEEPPPEPENSAVVQIPLAALSHVTVSDIIRFLNSGHVPVPPGKARQIAIKIHALTGGRFPEVVERLARAEWKGWDEYLIDPKVP